MIKRSRIIFCVFLVIISAIAFCIALEVGKALYTILASIFLCGVIIYLYHVNRCPHCGKTTRILIFEKQFHCHNCGELIEFE